MGEDDENNVTQVMPDHPEFIALSQEAKEFKSSLFGSYLMDKAAERAGDAARQLCDVNPLNTTKIIELQSDAQSLKLLNEFLNKAINIGDAEYADYLYKINEEG